MPEAISSLDIKSSSVKPANVKQPKKNAKPAAPVAEPEQVKHAKVVVTKPKPVETPVASKNSFRFRESASNRYLVTLPKTVTLEQAEDPRFMESCLLVKSREFGSFDEIFCVGKDAAWAVEMMVIDSEPGILNLAYQRSHQFAHRETGGEARMPAGFSIHRDRLDGLYYCQRDSDEHVFISGCHRREDCLRQLLDHAMFRTD